jgi:two-component system phosphate regulon sensor histidine kinase PhoR
MGKSSIHALGSAELSTRAKEISQAAAGTSLTMQLPVGGQRRTFSVFLAPFPEHQEQHVLCVFHDISLLQEMAARQSDFTANAAHELATPLTSISGFAETLLDDDFSAPEQSRKFIQTIYNEAQRMNRLLRDLLQLSRLDSQEYRRQLVIEPVDCCTLPPLLAQKLAPQLKSKELQFCQSLAKGPVFVEANRDLLLQVLANLTENAIKYTPKGGTITLSCLQEKEIVRLQVTDTGIGIPAKDLPFIFDRFYRADKARDRQTGGNGIGLSLVKFLVEIFGGTITVTSELQQGTTFTLEFPACP